MAEKGMSAEEITQLLERYAIGKKPLARLLGWGETTVLTYAKTGCPAGEFAAKLQRISAEPLYFSELLEQGKDRLTPVAYKKCKTALQGLLAPSKTEAAAGFLAARANADISPLRVVMTIFYAQAVSSVLAKEPFFPEDCDLSENGEIPYARLYEKIRRQGMAGLAGLSGERYPVVQKAVGAGTRGGKAVGGMAADASAEKSRGYIGEGMLNVEEQQLLGELYDILAWYGPEELKKIFATERPYLKKSKAEDGRRFIRHAAFASYYKKVAQGYKITVPADFGNYFSERAGRKKYRKA